MFIPTDIHLYIFEALPATNSSKVAHQVKYEQDDEHEPESTAAANVPAVSISAAAEKENKDNNKKDQAHNNIGWWLI